MIRTITALCFLVSTVTVFADDVSAPHSGRSLVNEFLADVDTLTSRFEQTLIGADGEVLEISSGTLEINRPGQFRWAFDEPYEQWLIADGLNIWSYDVDLAQATVKPQAEALANTPGQLLGGSVEAMNEFEFDGVVEEDGLTWVRMRPVDTDSGFSRLELAFSDRTLARMVFFDNLEQTTMVSLTDVVVNQAIDPAHFKFEVPQGVDVVGTRALPDSESP